MAYNPILRLTMYRRVIQEVTHILASPDLNHVLQWIKTYSSRWEELTSLKNSCHDYLDIMHIIDILIEDHPEEDWLRCIRAFLLCGIEYYAAAREDIEHVLCHDPRNLAAKQILAEIWYHARQYEKAFAAISDVIKQDPLCTRAYMDRVVLIKVLAFRTQDIEDKKIFYELALSDLQKLMNLLPSPEVQAQVKIVQNKLNKLSQA